MPKVDLNEIARVCYENDQGVAYAYGDHAWPAGCPTGTDALKLIDEKVRFMGFEPDHLRSDVWNAKEHCLRLMSYPRPAVKVPDGKTFEEWADDVVSGKAGVSDGCLASSLDEFVKLNERLKRSE
jgi:hypothetical protein